MEREEKKSLFNILESLFGPDSYPLASAQSPTPIFVSPGTQESQRGGASPVVCPQQQQRSGPQAPDGSGAEGTGGPLANACGGHQQSEGARPPVSGP